MLKVFSIIRRVHPDQIIITTKTIRTFWFSKTFQRSKWSPTPCSSTVTRKATILRIVSFSTRCLDLIINWLDQSWKQLDSHRRSLMNGIFSGVPQVARAIYMKAWTSTRRLIIFHRVTKSLEKIGSASILWECKRDMENSISISFPTPTFFLMNLESSMSTTKSWNSMTVKRISGS